MDCFGGEKKCYKNQYEGSLISLTTKVRLLEEEMKAIVSKREEESKGYERDMVVYTFKEAEWKQERKKLKEEVKRLRKVVEEKEEKIRELEVKIHVGFGHVRGGHDQEKNVITDKSYVDNQVVNIMESSRREEGSSWRDEAVDKWKKLYLAIKTELDDLIQRTHGHRETVYRRAEEDEMIEELKMELKAKEESIEELQARLRRAEQEEAKRKREVDILRQSLRIISINKKASSSCLARPKLSLLKQAKKIT